MKLSVLRGNKLLGEFDFENEIAGIAGPHSFFIGRSEECSIQLDDKQVSREHAKIIFDNEKWMIERLSESSNIIVNTALCTQKELNNGDVIIIGPFVLNVTLLPPVLMRPMGAFPNEQTIGATVSQTESVQEPSPSSNAQSNIDEVKENQVPLIEFENDPEVIETPVESLENSDGVSSYEDNAGNSAAPQGEVSSAEVPMLFSDAPADDESQQSGEDNNSDLPMGEDVIGRTQVVKAFANFYLEIIGEYAPYDSYSIEKNEIFIGRDESKCQIVLKDSEVSSVHAVVRKNNIICTLEDLNSSNGTILNAKRINKATLTTDDEFIIGSTTFTFKIESDLIQDEKSRLMPVEENQEIEVIEEVEEVVTFDASENGSENVNAADPFSGTSEVKEKSIIKRIWKDPAQRKKLIYGLVVLVVLWVFLDDSGKAPATKKPVASKEGAKEQSNLLVTPDANKQTDDSKDPNKPVAPKKVAKKMSKEELETVEARYLLAKDHYDKGKYREAMFELENIFSITPEYKKSRDMYDLSKQGLARLEQLEEQRRKEQEKRERQEKIKILVEKAKEATNDKKQEVAEALFGEILKLDPENYDVPQMKLEIEAWKREQERIANEIAMKEAERTKKVLQLAPGKSFYLKKEWYKAIIKLEEFTKVTPMDEDLTKEGVEMLADSRTQLQGIVSPLVGKARSLKEGQDLKGAYEVYLQVLGFDPINVEALNEMAEIRDTLFNRARKIYREAIISESLSLFDDAKEKFQEVQQISPSDSDYYKKASDKLKDYTE